MLFMLPDRVVAALDDDMSNEPGVAGVIGLDNEAIQFVTLLLSGVRGRSEVLVASFVGIKRWLCSISNNQQN